jgi:hypothetical protein
MNKLEQLNIENQRCFNDLIANFLEKTDRSIEWLVSIIASRSTYQSQLYFSLLQLLIATEDEFLNSEKIKYRSRTKNVLFLRLKDIYYIIRLVFMEVASKDSKRKIVITGNSVKLVDTFILSNSIKERKYIDRYYNELLSNLPIEERSMIFFLPTFLAKYSSADIQAIYLNSEENFIFRQDFLKPKDYIIAFWKLFKMRFPKKESFFFKNIDVTKEFYKEFYKTKYNVSSYQGILNYFLIKRLKESNVDLQLLIDWNENQPIDKGLIRGMKDFYPNVKTKGYQGYIVSTDFNFYIIPTDFEIQNKVIPDEIVVIGDSLQKQVNRFSNQVKVSTGPAFRFSNVYKEYKREAKIHKKIMLALPIGLIEAMDIMNLSIEVLRELSDDIQIQIKPHPLLSIDKLKKMLAPKWLDNYKIVDGDFNELVNQVDILIGSSSSSLLETLSRGIPVIIIVSQNGIMQNPIPNSINKRIWSLVKTDAELAKHIDRFICPSTEDRDKFQHIAKEVRRNYFEPVTKELVLKFLDFRNPYLTQKTTI